MLGNSSTQVKEAAPPGPIRKRIIKMHFSHRTPPRSLRTPLTRSALQPAGPEVDCQPAEYHPGVESDTAILSDSSKLNKDGSGLPQAQVLSVFLKKNVGKPVAPPADLLASIQNRIAKERARLIAEAENK